MGYFHYKSKWSMLSYRLNHPYLTKTYIKAMILMMHYEHFKFIRNFSLYKVFWGKCFNLIENPCVAIATPLWWHWVKVNGFQCYLFFLQLFFYILTILSFSSPNSYPHHCLLFSSIHFSPIPIFLFRKIQAYHGCQETYIISSCCNNKHFSIY